jgi:hypothetical protein
MKKLISLLIFAFLAVSASAATIYVDANGTGDYPTIQAAVDAAFDGDEIIVLPGTYTGLTTVSKSLVIRSTDPNDPAIVDSTIVDGQLATGCFDFSGSNKHSELSGFTIQNGLRPSYGSVCLHSGTLNIKNCCFQFNRESAIRSI